MQKSNEISHFLKFFNLFYSIEDKYRSAGLPEAFFSQKVPENHD